jgi:phage I-like protein
MNEALTCRLPAGFPAVEIGTGTDAPRDIQYMPPGRHTIEPTKAGKPVKVTVQVDESVAAALQRTLEAALAAGEKPWFDYNHADGAASGHPVRFFWAGTDPVQGGVRAEVAWTPRGAEAIAAREFRHFSPAFLFDGQRITGAPLNMGGLVNASAFRHRQPLFSKAHVNESNPMNEDPAAALQAQYDATAAENATLKAQLATALQKVTALEAQVTEQATALKAHRTQFAQAKVAEAVTARRLPPQATELHAKWQGLIEADPSHAELLASLPAADIEGRLTSGAPAPAPAAPKPTAERWA